MGQTLPPAAHQLFLAPPWQAAPASKGQQAIEAFRSTPRLWPTIKENGDRSLPGIVLLP